MAAVKRRSVQMFMGRGAPRMGSGIGGGGQHSSPTRCTAMTACKKSLKFIARRAKRSGAACARRGRPN
eukprot:213273-Chlamydomonas_euryale.AAC.1